MSEASASRFGPRPTNAAFSVATGPISPRSSQPKQEKIPVPQHGPSVLRFYAMGSTFEPIPSQLASHPHEARMLGNLNETCLHWSCFQRGPAYAILPIAESYPEACGIVGACGRSPLHIVCAGGGRGTVNGSEETVDVAERLAGYNVNMSVLISVEDGETPISALWGVFARQCQDFLGDVLRKLDVADVVADGGNRDEEFAAMIRRVLRERREERARKAREECQYEKPRANAPPQAFLPQAMTAAELEPNRNGVTEGTVIANRKRNRSISPPMADVSDVSNSHVPIQAPSTLPQLPVRTVGAPCQCHYKSNLPSVDPVQVPPSFQSASEEMDENIRVLLVQIEKMLVLIHAADYVLATYPADMPEPLATKSPVGGHFIFHAPPEVTPQLDGRPYGPWWKDDAWDPICGALRVYDRLGELGAPESFIRLLIGLSSDDDENAKRFHVALSFKSSPSSIIQLLLKRQPSVAKSLCSLVFGRHPRYSLHVAISHGRTWSEGVSDLISANPAALTVRDTETGLYPFMLAASHESISRGPPSRMKLGVGKHMISVLAEEDKKAEGELELCTLNNVFMLLSECPVLVMGRQSAFEGTGTFG